MKSYGISCHVLSFFSLFSVKSGFKWFWMGSFRKNIQLMLKFCNSSFLVVHFSNYKLMTFVMMIPVVLLSVLIIQVCTLSVVEASHFWQLLHLKWPKGHILEINKATTKTANEMWLAKVAAIFIHRTKLTCNNAYNSHKSTLFSVMWDL